MASFGQYLKRERETRGISLRDISDSTRITIRYLEALEADRLELIPRQFFVRAIIRSYAKAVGLDENQVMGKFDNKLEFGEQLEYRASAAVEAAPPRSGFPGWARALIGALLVIAAGVMIYFFFLSPRKPGGAPAKAEPAITPPAAAATESHPAVAVESALEDAPAPDTTTPTTPPAPQPQAPPVEPFTGLAIEATFAAETWLRVTADGAQVFEGNKQPGDTLAVTAERLIVLSTGNAGGMDFTLNGRPARPLGTRGVVMTDIRLTPDNFKTFLAPEPAD